MLRHLGEENAANHIRLALEKVYTEKQHLTRDVGGTAGTSEFADAMIEALHTIPPPQAELQEVQT
jgi:isocitrate dehydrogenase (NAD+)